MNRQQLVKKAIRGLDRALSTAFLAVLLLLLFFAFYVTSENHRIVAEASSDVYQSYKPSANDISPFRELETINPEVIGWLTVNATKIDYPVVQGKNNEKYVNTSVAGDFSLSGAIFLDCRNAPDFSDTLSIIHGHNMTGDVMFGGIDKYEDPEYFFRHLSGKLFCGDTYYDLTFFSYFRADGHDDQVYNPRLKAENFDTWLDHVKDLTVNCTEEFPETGPILLMSTCASGQTNERNLLAATIRPGDAPPPENGEAHATHTGTRLRSTGEERSPWPYLISFGIVLIALTAVWFMWKRKREGTHGE